MTTPLPPSMQVQQRPDFANTGLWYDKFCSTWKIGWVMDAPAKVEWIKTVAGKCGDRNLLREHTIRLKKLAEHGNGNSRVFSTRYRFVSGMGREHPVENGFAWHHTLGVPYLPGSSVKGMVRSYLDTWTERNQLEIKRIFGPRRWQDEQGQWHDTDPTVGTVLFLDAIPIAQVVLKADIMTPHYGPYYQDGKTPGDWHSPTPIPFLTVDEGAKFLFTLLPRTRSEEHLQDCAMVLAWLTEALQTTGAGAKTAIGYGRFKPEEQAPKGPPPPSTHHPIFAEIESANRATMEHVATQIGQLADPSLKQEAGQHFLQKINKKEFSKIRRKAGEQPGHWLNDLKKTITKP
jgi:CRISPR-associated protein Cmr6